MSGNNSYSKNVGFGQSNSELEGIQLNVYFNENSFGAGALQGCIKMTQMFGIYGVVFRLLKLFVFWAKANSFYGVVNPNVVRDFSV